MADSAELLAAKAILADERGRCGERGWVPELRSIVLYIEQLEAEIAAHGKWRESIYAIDFKDGDVWLCEEAKE